MGSSLAELGLTMAAVLLISLLPLALSQPSYGSYGHHSSASVHVSQVDPGHGGYGHGGYGHGGYGHGGYGHYSAPAHYQYGFNIHHSHHGGHYGGIMAMERGKQSPAMVAM